MNLQRAFAPEEIGPGHYNNILNSDESRSYQVTLGGKGMVGDWDYSASFTRGEYRLDQNRFARWKDKIEGFFGDTVLGPRLGTTADGFGIYNPDYAAFYSPITPASFTGYGTHRSKTWQNLGRVQVTNGCSLPGGDAGLAVVLEGGSEGWDYSPDQAFVDGNAWAPPPGRCRPPQQLRGDQRTAHAGVRVADHQRLGPLRRLQDRRQDR